MLGNTTNMAVALDASANRANMSSAQDAGVVNWSRNIIKDVVSNVSATYQHASNQRRLDHAELANQDGTSTTLLRNVPSFTGEVVDQMPTTSFH